MQAETFPCKTIALIHELARWKQRWMPLMAIAALGLAGCSSPRSQIHYDDIFADRQTSAAPPVSSVSPDGPLPISATSEVDETLFLVRALESTYQSWPGPSEKPAVLQQWLAETRSRMERIRATIDARQLDSNLDRLYRDGVALLDAYETYLSNLGAIDRNDARQANVDRVNVIVVAATRAAQGGFIGGVLGGLEESIHRGSARDEQRQRELNAEARRLRNTWTATADRAQVFVENLSRKARWRPSEAGFDGDQNRTLAENVLRRPRDPFLKARVAQATQPDATADQLMLQARSLIAAARLVPDGLAYDEFRIEFLANASDLAVSAAILQLPDRSYSRGPAPLAQEAIQVCNTLLAANPDDPAGLAETQLARALAAAGRYEEATVAVKRAETRRGWRNEPYFSVRAAKIMSLAGKPDEAARWLRSAYQLGYSDIAEIRNTPDLVTLRQKRVEEYTALTTIRYTLVFDPGYASHDFVVRNDSAFDLTNVRIVAIVQTNEKQTRSELGVAAIQAGKSQRFSNVFFDMSIKITPHRVSSTLISDQSPSR